MSRLNADTRLEFSLMTTAVLSAALLVLVVAFLLKESWPALQGMGWWRFISSEGWYPLDQQYSLAPMLIATAITGIGALLLAAPFGIAVAVFSVFYAPPATAGALQNLIGLMAGIPSVVYGFWGLTVLVPLIAAWEPPGASLLAAVIVLALMVLPTVMLTTKAALLAVPGASLMGATALGITRQGIILHIALPAAQARINAGILLATARALGETMAVLMVAGNVVQLPSSVFDPIRVLTANMALEMAYATGEHRSALFVSGLVLTGLVTVLTLLAYGFLKRGRHE